jgi:charged multivesicular body protein 5
MAGAKGTRLNTLKQKALQILRRRKMYDTQLGQVMNQQFNVDQVAFAQESIQTTINTVQALKAANVAQQAVMKNFNMDEMEDLFDDMADMMADMEEIQEVMGRTYNCDYDENELMDELNELDEEIVSEQLNEGLGLPSYIPNSQK